MFQYLQQRYKRADKFREEQDRRFKHTCLDVNYPRIVKFIYKVTCFHFIQNSLVKLRDKKDTVKDNL